LSLIVVFAFQNCGGGWKGMGGSGDPYEGLKDGDGQASPPTNGQPSDTPVPHYFCSLGVSPIGPIEAAIPYGQTVPIWIIDYSNMNSNPETISVPYATPNPMNIPMTGLGKLLRIDLSNTGEELSLTIRRDNSNTVTVILSCVKL
jgi:hypothetical protein